MEVDPQIYEDAATIIDLQGWWCPGKPGHQVANEHGGFRACTAIALGDALGDAFQEDPHADRHPAFWSFAEFLGLDVSDSPYAAIVGWNDSRVDAAEVTLNLRKCAEALRAEQAQ